jgi:hypothetical protein
MYNLENEKSGFGIYVERSPNNKSGEISPASGNAFDIPSNRNHREMNPNHLLYIVFPGSCIDFGGKAPRQEMINQIGGKNYQQNKKLINDDVNAAKGNPTKNNYDRKYFIMKRVYYIFFSLIFVATCANIQVYKIQDTTLSVFKINDTLKYFEFYTPECSHSNVGCGILSKIGQSVFELKYADVSNYYKFKIVFKELLLT